MKKGLITFCAFVLLATQAPAANAAATTGGVSGDSHVKPSKSTQTYKYKTIVLNNCFYNWDSISKFIKIDKVNSVDMKVFEKGTKVKEDVSKGTEEKTPVSNAKPEQTTTEVEKQEVKTEPKETVSEVEKAPVTTTEQKQTVTEVEKTPEVTTEQPKVPVTEAKTEQPKATETTSPSTQPTTAPSTTPVASTSSNIDAIEAAVVELTNAERVKAGLQPLKAYAPLMAAAREKSQDMKDKNYFSHTSPTYGSPFDRLKALGISYQSAGENIAKGQRTAEEVVTAWMNSEGHRANILNANFTHIGVGYVKDGNIWTQQFIKQ